MSKKKLKLIFADLWMIPHRQTSVKMPTQTVKLVIDLDKVEFSLKIQDSVKKREERYLPDDIVELIIDWKTLKDAEIDRLKLMKAHKKAYNEKIALIYLDIFETSDDERLSRTRRITELDKDISRMQEDYIHAHDVFRAALLKVGATY